MSGRSPPLHCTLPLIAIFVLVANAKKTLLMMRTNLNASRPDLLIIPQSAGKMSKVVSHIQRIGCQPEKLLYTGDPARGLLHREKRTKEKSLAAYPPTPTLLVRSKIYIKITRCIYRRYTRRSRSVSRPHKDPFDSSARSRVLLRIIPGFRVR